MQYMDDFNFFQHCEFVGNGLNTRCECRVPPPRFELQIFILPAKGGYSTRPPWTTSSLIIWVEVYVASVTYFLPTERRVNSPERRGRRGGSTGRVRGSCDRRGEGA
jgi:hypothetical protein